MTKEEKSARIARMMAEIVAEARRLADEIDKASESKDEEEPVEVEDNEYLRWIHDKEEDNDQVVG